jgi:methionyl aminopeptidase
MAINIKNQAEMQAMREGGAILAKALNAVCEAAKPGVNTLELDELAERVIRDNGAKPGFKGFHGFPATICSAVNEIVVHGIPSKNQVLKEGDLFTVDCGVLYKGLNTDAARSIGIGEISETKQKLIDTAKLALNEATKIVKPGLDVNEIGKRIEQIVRENGFYILRELTGHGIGANLHEEPTVYNYDTRQRGPKLKAGMTIAIEPIFATNEAKIITLDDDWTIVTHDSSLSVQQENTILITENGYEILTENNLA